MGASSSTPSVMRRTGFRWPKINVPAVALTKRRNAESQNAENKNGRTATICLLALLPLVSLCTSVLAGGRAPDRCLKFRNFRFEI